MALVVFTDSGDDGETVEERSGKGPSAGDVARARPVSSVFARLRSHRLVVVVIFPVVSLHDELDDLLLEELHLDRDGLVPLAGVEHVQLVRNVPQIADRRLAHLDHILVAPLLVLRLDGHEGERAHDDVANDQAANADVAEEESDEFTSEFLDFVETRIRIGNRRVGRRPPHRSVVRRMVPAVR